MGASLTPQGFPECPSDWVSHPLKSEPVNQHLRLTSGRGRAGSQIVTASVASFFPCSEGRTPSRGSRSRTR